MRFRGSLSTTSTKLLAAPDVFRVSGAATVTSPEMKIAYGHLDLPTEWKEVLNERAGIVLLEVTIVQNRGKIKRIDRVFSEQREELKVLLLVLIPNS